MDDKAKEGSAGVQSGDIGLALCWVQGRSLRCPNAFGYDEDMTSPSLRVRVMEFFDCNMVGLRKRL